MTNPNRINYHRTPAELRTIEDALSPDINDAHARRYLDLQPIVVEPVDDPKGPSKEHLEALADAQRRIGHKTGPIAVREAIERQ